MIVVLTADRLEEAVVFAKRVFPHEDDHPEPALRAIFSPHRQHQYFLDHKIFNRTCWSAISDEGKIIGLIGLYYELADFREAVHVGWFCVEPESRRKGIGGSLLDLAIEEARVSGAEFLRLDTSTDAIAARHCYFSRGLHIVKQVDTTVYMEMRLRPAMAIAP